MKQQHLKNVYEVQRSSSRTPRGADGADHGDDGEQAGSSNTSSRRRVEREGEGKAQTTTGGETIPCSHNRGNPWEG